MYILLIVLHTVAGLLAFGLGCAVLRPPVDVAGLRFRVYLGSLIALVVFLIGAIATHWPDLATTPRLIYVALTALGLFMVWRAGRARSVRPQDARYVEHVGFTLIALFDGFVIVSAIDLGAPVWLVIAVAVAAVLVGRRVIARVRETGRVGATAAPVAPS